MNNKWQYEFFKSIAELDSDKMKLSLSNGAIMNNEQNKKNTLNCAIRVLFDQSPENFNVKFIENLINSGASICNVGANSVFALINMRMLKYNYKDEIKENIENLINLLVNHGAKF